MYKLNDLRLSRDLLGDHYRSKSLPPIFGEYVSFIFTSTSTYSMDATTPTPVPVPTPRLRKSTNG